MRFCFAAPEPAKPRKRDKRNFGRSAAHEADPLPLLPSGPGGVRGESLHRARSSTDRQSALEILMRDRFAKSSTRIQGVKGADETAQKNFRLRTELVEAN